MEDTPKYFTTVSTPERQFELKSDLILKQDQEQLMMDMLSALFYLRIVVEQPGLVDYYRPKFTDLLDKYSE